MIGIAIDGARARCGRRTYVQLFFLDASTSVTFVINYFYYFMYIQLGKPCVYYSVDTLHGNINRIRLD